MSRMTAINVRLGDRQLKQLAKLADKLALDRAAVIRLAIAQFVEAEAARSATLLAGARRSKD